MTYLRRWTRQEKVVIMALVTFAQPLTLHL
jgi:hypothetical protein